MSDDMAEFSHSLVRRARDEQDLFRAAHKYQLRQDLFPFSCNPGHWQLNECSSSLLEILPVLVSILVLISWLSKPLYRFRPQWMKPFIEELNEQAEIRKTRRKITRSTTALLILIPCGLAVQLVAALYPFPSLSALLAALSWVTSNPRLHIYC